MKVYKVAAQFPHRTSAGEDFPVRFTATRQEARSVAREMVNAAASNPNLDGYSKFRADVYVCHVTESLGKGRNLAVALLNGRGIAESDVNPIDSICSPARKLRCDGCGKPFKAQDLTPTPQGAICDVCFDKFILFDPSALQATEDMIAQADEDFRRAMRGTK